MKKDQGQELLEELILEISPFKLGAIIGTGVLSVSTLFALLKNMSLNRQLKLLNIYMQKECPQYKDPKNCKDRIETEIKRVENKIERYKEKGILKTSLQKGTAAGVGTIAGGIGIKLASKLLK